VMLESAKKIESVISNFRKDWLPDYHTTAFTSDGHSTGG
jgi:hypothetical protein